MYILEVCLYINTRADKARALDLVCKAQLIYIGAAARKGLSRKVEGFRGPVDVI